MPCWEVNLVTVEFKARHKQILFAALDRLKIEYRENGDRIFLTNVSGRYIDLAEGKVVVESYMMDTVNKIKQEYSKIVVEQVAKKKKWAIKRLAEDKYKLKRF